MIMVYILTGNGKGKTTSAIGMGVRASGSGRRVLMIQFLKPGASSEIKVIKKIENFEVKSFGQKHFILPKVRLEKRPELKKIGVKPISKKDFKLVNDAFRLAQKTARERKYDLLILDEIFIAIFFKLLGEKEVLNFLKKYRSHLDIVLTGRHCPKGFLELADLVTEFRQKKHYYKNPKEGGKAEKGIER